MAISQRLLKSLLITLLSVLIFVAVSLHFTYSLTNKIFSSWAYPTIDDNGCPTTFGLVVHAIVFALLVFGSMFIPWDKLCNGTLGRLSKKFCFKN